MSGKREPEINQATMGAGLQSIPGLPVLPGEDHHQHEVRVGKDAIPFPLKLHRLLDNAEALAFDDAIAWMPDGRSFRIFDKVKLETVVMPNYFHTSKFKSFQRSLNLWGFLTAKRTSPYVGSEHGCRFHPMFVRGQPELCYQMQRTRIKTDKKRVKANALQDTVSQIISDDDEDSKSRTSSSSIRYGNISESEPEKNQDKKQYKNSPRTSSNATKNNNAPTAAAAAAAAFAGVSSALTSFSAQTNSPAVHSDVSPLSALLVQILVGLARLRRQEEGQLLEALSTTSGLNNALTYGVVQQQLPQAAATSSEATSQANKMMPEPNFLAKTSYAALLNELQRRELLATAKTDLLYASESSTNRALLAALQNAVPPTSTETTPNLLSSLQTYFR